MVEKRIKKRKKREWELTLMILPAVVYVFVFSYLPIVGLSMAFQNYSYTKGIFSEFVGLKNFEYLTATGVLYRITRNTIGYNLLFILFGTLTKLTCAIMLVEFTSRRFQKIAQTFTFMPYFISWVVVSAIAYNILGYENGLLNSVLIRLDMEPVNVYLNKKCWPVILVFFHIWKGLGYGTVVYAAAIMGIDQDIYEAAEIDGATAWRKITNITLPLLKPTVIIMLLLDISHVARGDFDMFYNLVGKNSFLFSTTDIIDTYVYRALAETANVGMGAAASFYQAILCFIIITIANGTIKKLQPDYALY